MIDDTRAVTAPIEYILTFAIAGILVTGLIIAATGQVERQRSQTVEAQMNVVGQQLAGSLEMVDREIQSGSTSTIVERELPEELLGQGYTITVESNAVVISSQVADFPLNIPYETETAVDSTPVTLSGGEVVIEWDGTVLEVRDA